MLTVFRQKQALTYVGFLTLRHLNPGSGRAWCKNGGFGLLVSAFFFILDVEHNLQSTGKTIVAMRSLSQNHLRKLKRESASQGIDEVAGAEQH